MAPAARAPARAHAASTAASVQSDCGQFPAPMRPVSARVAEGGGGGGAQNISRKSAAVHENDVVPGPASRTTGAWPLNEATESAEYPRRSVAVTSAATATRWLRSHWRDELLESRAAHEEGVLTHMHG